MRGNRLIIIIVIFILLMGAAGVVAANNSETIQITNETSLLDVSPIIVVNETFDQGGPSLIFEDNHFCISYHSNEKGNWDIFVKKFDFNWNTIEKKRITTNEYVQSVPSITFANNRFYIAYQSYEKGNEDIFVEKYDMDFNRIGEPRQITNDSSDQRDPSIIAMENHFYIAYESDETGNFDIFVEKYDLNLNPIGKKQITNDGYGQFDPSIIFVKDILYIAYESYKNDWDIFIKQYDLDLTPVGEEKPIITDGGAQEEASVIFANNSLYVAYFSNEKGNWDIFVKKFDLGLNCIETRQIMDIGFYDYPYPSITYVNKSLYLAYNIDKNIYVVTGVEKIPPIIPHRPLKPPTSLIYLIIACLLVFSGALIYKKRDEFMTSKRYRYFVLVIAGTILILFAYDLTYPYESNFGFVLAFLSAPLYTLLVGAISKHSKESFIFGSFAFLCFSFGSILMDWLAYENYEATETGIALFIIFYLPFVAFSVASQHLMSWLKEKVKRKITKFKPVPNPYVAGIPIRDKEMFFGRKDVFDFLKQKFITGKTTTNVFLYGGRRIGKTSSLYQIKGGALGDKFIPVFVDLQGIGDMDTYGFFSFITQEIRKTLEEKGIEMKEYAFGSAKESYTATFNRVLDDIPDLIKDKQMIFMFDETEIIEEMVRKGRFDSAIYSYCESIMQHRPKISCIFTSSPGALSRKREDKPLFRAASYKEISFLEKEDAIELIKKPVEGFARYTDKVIERILCITGSHPFYIQYICYELVSILNKEKRNNVRMKDIDLIINRLIKGAPMHLGYVWDNVSYDEKIVLSLLSEIISKEDTFISVSAIEKYKNLKEKKGETTIKLSERIEKILEDLQHEDILEKDLKNRYRYKVDLIRYWVKEYYAVWRVIGEEEHESISE